MSAAENERSFFIDTSPRRTSGPQFAMARQIAWDGGRALEIEMALRDAGATPDEIRRGAESLLDDMVLNLVLARVPNERIIERFAGRGFHPDEIGASINRVKQDEAPGAGISRIAVAMTVIGWIAVAIGFILRVLNRNGLIPLPQGTTFAIIVGGFLLILYSPIVEATRGLLTRKRYPAVPKTTKPRTSGPTETLVAILRVFGMP